MKKFWAVLLKKFSDDTPTKKFGVGIHDTRRKILTEKNVAVAVANTYNDSYEVSGNARFRIQGKHFDTSLQLSPFVTVIFGIDTML